MSKIMHFIGIGGAGMSALAQYALNKGYTVTGSDATSNEYTELLQSKGATVFLGHNAKNLPPRADLCVVSAAISADNPELNKAKAEGIKIIERAEYLAEVFNGFKKSVAISGSHGKTTTTALVFCILQNAGILPTLFLGGEYGKTGNFCDGSDICVAEACEYKGSFLKLSPDIAVVLNVDLDHTDCYPDKKSLIAAFDGFAAKVKSGGKVIIRADLKDELTVAGKNIVTFDVDKTADVIAKNLSHDGGKFCFDIYEKGEFKTRAKLSVAGRHNVFNALAAYCVCRDCGVSPTKIAEGLQKFEGVKRRFERFESNFTNVIADYAHHPTEISLLLDTVKRQGYKKIFVLFQPHTYSRTRDLYGDFCKCFCGAKKVYVLPVFSAREKYDKAGDSRRLVRGINRFLKARYVADFKTASRLIKKRAGKNDVVLVVGAGNVIDFCCRLYLDK